MMLEVYSADRAIREAVNDKFTLRKVGSTTDAHAVFKSMLHAGDLGHTLEALLKRAKESERKRKRTKVFRDTGSWLGPRMRKL